MNFRFSKRWKGHTCYTFSLSFRLNSNISGNEKKNQMKLRVIQHIRRSRLCTYSIYSVYTLFDKTRQDKTRHWQNRIIDRWIDRAKKTNQKSKSFHQMYTKESKGRNMIRTMTWFQIPFQFLRSRRRKRNNNTFKLFSIKDFKRFVIASKTICTMYIHKYTNFKACT